MTEKKISEMSLEELILYREQLTEKISEIKFYLENARRGKKCANSGK